MDANSCLKGLHSQKMFELKLMAIYYLDFT